MRILIRYRDTGASSKMTLTEFPCSIGRAPGSQINLPHESISANHAVIEKREGVYLIRDLESKNGLVSDNTRLPSIMLNPHTIISVGIVDIEVIDMTASRNEDTQPLSAPPRSSMPGILPSTIALALLPLITILKTYFLGTLAVSIGMVAVGFVLGFIFIFSAFSAWISSFFDTEYRFKKAFLRILLITSLFFGVDAIVELFSPYLAFNLDDTELWRTIHIGTSVLFIGGFLTFYCKAVFLGGYRRGLGITGSSFASLTGLLILLGTLSSPPRSHLAGSITPAFRSFTRENRSLADFDQKMKLSFDKIEKERQKAYEKAKASEAESGK